MMGVELFQVKKKKKKKKARGGGGEGMGALKAKHLGYHEKLSPGENTVLYPGKTRLKSRLF